MSEIVLLGAGASVEADIPAAFEMSRQIVDRFNSLRGANESEAHILNFVVGGLLLKAGERNHNPFVGGGKRRRPIQCSGFARATRELRDVAVCGVMASACGKF